MTGNSDVEIDIYTRTNLMKGEDVVFKRHTSLSSYVYTSRPQSLVNASTPHAESLDPSPFLPLYRLPVPWTGSSAAAPSVL